MMNIENDFMEFARKVGLDFGMDNLCSQIFGILYVEPEEVSMDDLAKRTGYSLASVSNKMKFLEGIGLTQKIKNPGSKKLYYYMEKNVFKMVKNKLQTGLQKEIQPAKQIIPSIIDKYKNAKLDEKQKKQFKIITDYYHQMLKFEELINEFNNILDKQIK